MISVSLNRKVYTNISITQIASKVVQKILNTGGGINQSAADE